LEQLRLLREHQLCLLQGVGPEQVWKKERAELQVFVRQKFLRELG
jgi:hypothetical protein